VPICDLGHFSQTLAHLGKHERVNLKTLFSELPCLSEQAMTEKMPPCPPKQVTRSFRIRDKPFVMIILTP
jgi:hypothetical protein